MIKAEKIKNGNEVDIHLKGEEKLLAGELDCIFKAFEAEEESLEVLKYCVVEHLRRINGGKLEQSK